MKKIFIRTLISCSLALNVGLVYCLHDASQTGIDAFAEIETANNVNKDLVQKNDKLKQEIKDIKFVVSDLKDKLANGPK